MNFVRGQVVTVSPPRRQQFRAKVLFLPGDKTLLGMGGVAEYILGENEVYVEKVYDHYVAPSKRVHYGVHKNWIYV